jgi:hypothetical protein
MIHPLIIAGKQGISMDLRDGIDCHPKAQPYRHDSPIRTDQFPMPGGLRASINCGIEAGTGKEKLINSMLGIR